MGPLPCSRSAKHGSYPILIMESFFSRRLNIVNIEREPPGHRSPHRGVIADLKTLGFLAARGKAGLTLVDAHRLAEAWAVSYPLRLRPNLDSRHPRRTV